MTAKRNYHRFVSGRGGQVRTEVTNIFTQPVSLAEIDGVTILAPGETKPYDFDLQAGLRTFTQKRTLNRLIQSGAIRLDTHPYSFMPLDSLPEAEEPVVTSDTSGGDGDKPDADNPGAAGNPPAGNDADTNKEPSDGGELPSDTPPESDGDQPVATEDGSNEEPTEQPATGDDADTSKEPAAGPEEPVVDATEVPTDTAPEPTEEPADTVVPEDPEFVVDDTESGFNQLSREDRLQLLVEIPGIGSGLAEKLLALETVNAESVASVPRMPKDEQTLAQVLAILQL